MLSVWVWKYRSTPTFTVKVFKGSNFVLHLPRGGVFSANYTSGALANPDWLCGFSLLPDQKPDKPLEFFVISNCPFGQSNCASTIGTMSDEFYQRPQCTCSAFFLTSDALDAHLEEYQVSTPQLAGTELTSSSRGKATYPLSSRYAEVTRKLLATMMKKMITSTATLHPP